MYNIRRSIPKLFKDGYKQFSGIEESILSNTEAVRQFSEILRTSFGPNGMNKIIINHIDKEYITNDCSTIVEQLEIEHPAANILVHPAAMQEKEIGDGSNLVIIFSGELLKKAEKLINIGIHPSDIISGYEKAHIKSLQILEKLTIKNSLKIRSLESLSQACRTSIASKCFGLEEFLSTKIAEACLIALPENPKEFLVDNVRTLKILGSNIYQTQVVNGMIVQYCSKTNVKNVNDCKVLVLTTNIGLREMDVSQKILFNDDQELLNFSKTEEKVIQESIKQIYELGVRLLILSNNPTDLEIHYLNKYGIYTITIMSKFSRRRVCRMLKARSCVTKDIISNDLGYIQTCKEIKIGGQTVTMFMQKPGESCVGTIVIRSASTSIMDDIERACHDGINTIRAMCRENKFVPGGGATEIELAKQIQEFGSSCTGLEQYSVKAYGHALEIIPRTLALNNGMDFEDTITKLYAYHTKKQNTNIGINVLNKTVCNVVDKKIIDLLMTKKFAIRLATNATLTILRIDHIIMARPAGGPKHIKNKGYWDNDGDT
jgi:T-complex protein 1 subunit theta